MRSYPISYQNVELSEKYSDNLVKPSIRDSRPVFIAKITGNVGGHAWVLDGWMERTRTKTRVGSDGSRMPGTERQKLVHCNWGWNGSYNGYYISGIFKLKDGAVVAGNGDSSATGSSNNYDSKYCRVITYQIPSN